ncbi:MAG: hypothetical protein IK020_02405 [Clostridiales bacterium]|nr:hypothetical protein [Clostridiales bacterium]
MKRCSSSMRRLLPRAVAAILTISMLAMTCVGCRKGNSAGSDMTDEGGSAIRQDGSAGGNSAGATERVAGKYSYRGVYLDLPAEDGWNIYEIGNILFDGGSSEGNSVGGNSSDGNSADGADSDGGSYCVPVFYSHEEDGDSADNAKREYRTDILTVGLDGQIRNKIQMSGEQDVTMLLEKEYVVLSDVEDQWAKVNRGEMNESDIKNDILFLDRETGTQTNVIHLDMYAHSIYPVSDGYILVGSRTIARYSADWTLQATITTDMRMHQSEIGIFEQGGNIYLLSCEDERFSDYYRLDFTSQKAEYVINTDSFDSLIDRCDNQYFFSLDGEYMVDLPNMQIQTMALWNDTDIRPDKMNGYGGYVALDDTHFAKKIAYEDGSGDIGFFTYDSTLHLNCTEIVVGGYGLLTDKTLSWAVYNFNTANDDYRVVLRDYSDDFSWSTKQEAQEVKMKLLKYFREGNAPDIFYGEYFDYDYFGHAGIVMDMVPFFENDAAVNLESLIPSLRNLMMRDGEHCYYVFSSYYMNGYFGLRSDFSGSEVSLPEMKKMCDSSGKAMSAMQSAPALAGEALAYNYCDLWGAYGQAKEVTREDLEDLVETILALGVDPSVTWGEFASLQDVYSGLYYLATSGPSDVFELAREEKAVHDRIVFVGYPSMYDSVHVAVPSGQVAISSSTKNQEKCWEFVRQLLVPETQKKLGCGTVNSEVLDLVLRSAMAPDQVTDEDMKRFVLGHSAVSAEAAEDFRDCVDAVDAIRAIDWGVEDFIYEEISSYYTQQRTIEQIAATLDDRMDLYISENYQ